MAKPEPGASIEYAIYALLIILGGLLLLSGCNETQPEITSGTIVDLKYEKGHYYLAYEYNSFDEDWEWKRRWSPEKCHVTFQKYVAVDGDDVKINRTINTSHEVYKELKMGAYFDMNEFDKEHERGSTANKVETVEEASPSDIQS